MAQFNSLAYFVSTDFPIYKETSICKTKKRRLKVYIFLSVLHISKKIFIQIWKIVSMTVDGAPTTLGQNWIYWYFKNNPFLIYPII